MTRMVAELDAGTLPDDVGTLKALVGELLEALRSACRKQESLEHRLQQLLRQRFGPSAEKLDREQLLLFAREILEQGEPPPVTPAAADAKPDRRNGRKRPARDLPRLRVEHDVPEAERRCPCCGEERTRIGEETSEQYEYEPAKVFVIEHARLKYACRHCQGEVIVAEKPRQAIDRCLAGPGLLAQVAVSKYNDHLPLYRLESILKRNGVELTRSTMCGWMAGCAEALEPLVKLMRERVLGSKVVHTDDTPVPVQEKGRGKTREGRFWVYVGDRENPYAVFDYTPDRSGAGPQRWLSEFRGYLQADAYGGYDRLYATGDVTEVACWAHARRKFYDARMTDPARCLQAMAWIKRLYDIEQVGREQTLDAEALRALRQKESIPLLGQFKIWLDEQAPQVVPKSPVREAIEYLRGRWASFLRYTSNGILDIDNNAAENALRRVALGRKNWLFCGSDQGGQTAAVLFSLIASCKMSDLDPYAWFRDLLTRIADHPQSRLAELLPDRWAADHRAATNS